MLVLENAETQGTARSFGMQENVDPAKKIIIQVVNPNKDSDRFVTPVETPALKISLQESSNFNHVIPIH